MALHKYVLIDSLIDWTTYIAYVRACRHREFGNRTTDQDAFNAVWSWSWRVSSID